MTGITHATLASSGSGSFNQLNVTSGNTLNTFNTFNVQTTGSSSLNEVNGDAGNDTINLGNSSNSLSGIVGKVNVNGHGSMVPGGNVPVVRSLPQMVPCRRCPCSATSSTCSIPARPPPNTYSLRRRAFSARHGISHLLQCADDRAQYRLGHQQHHRLQHAALSNTTVNAAAGPRTHLRF